jgi:hypothetical protein
MKEEENDLLYCSYEQWNKCGGRLVFFYFRIIEKNRWKLNFFKKDRKTKRT